MLQATALNMSNMVGAGPFITIPLIIGAMGGPQCLLGWVLGAGWRCATAWSGANWPPRCRAPAAPTSTSRKSSAKPDCGEILPFLFIWQFIFSGPLEIASGYIGFAQYAGYFWRGMTPLAAPGALSVGALVVVLLYRRATAIGKMAVVLWAGMLATVAWIIVGGLTHFNAPVWPSIFRPTPSAFPPASPPGLGSAMLIAMYDFLGYYDICYVGGEVRSPVRTIPRSILYSVAVRGRHLCARHLSFIAVVPWREAMQSKFIASLFIERLYGPRAAAAVTALVLWTAFASVFALLFGYSRIPYAAAVNGHFFGVFARLHPTGQFPARVAAGDGTASPCWPACGIWIR